MAVDAIEVFIFFIEMGGHAEGKLKNCKQPEDYYHRIYGTPSSITRGDLEQFLSRVSKLSVY